MRFIFRADASKLSGTGHVARLLAIAEESLSRDIECIFIGNVSEPEWLLIKFHELGINHLSEKDVGKFSFQKSDCLFIDSYSIEISDPFISSNFWKMKILVADSSTPRYDSDLVFFIENLPVPERFLDSEVHHGFKYFPLKKSIKRIIPGSNQVRNLIVVGGGTDPFNFADEMSEILHGIEGFKKAVFVSEHFDSIANVDSRFEVLKFGIDLDLQINSSDLVFSTASTIALETIARGLPLGVACAIENQESFYNYLSLMKVASPVGLRSLNESWQLNPLKIDELVNNRKLRCEIVSESARIIDNKGAERIINKVLERPL